MNREWRQASTLVIENDSTIDGVHFPIVGMSLKVDIRESIVARPVSKVPRGGLFKESA